MHFYVCFVEISFENGSKLEPKIKGSFFVVCVGLALSGALFLELGKVFFKNFVKLKSGSC